MQHTQKFFFKRLIAFVLCFSLTFSMLCLAPPKASAVDPIITPSVVVTTLFGCFVGMAIDDLGEWRDSFKESAGDYLKWLFTPRVDDCKHVWKTDINGYQYCRKCDKPLSLFYKEREEEYLNSLDSTTASSGIATTGFSASIINWGTYAVDVDGVYKSSPENFLNCLYNLGVNKRCMITQITSSYLFGVYFDESGELRWGAFENPFAVAHCSYLGVYDLDALNLVESAGSRGFLNNGSVSYPRIYHCKTCAESSDGFLTSEVYSINWDKGCYGSGFDPYVYQKASTNSSWFSSTSNYFLLGSSDFSVLGSVYSYYPSSSSITWDNSRIVIQPSGTDSSSRGDDLMEMISDYNKTNSYLNDSTAVNYYIGTVNDDGSVDKFFEPGVFDEQTMIFTEPESGTEYQASSWEYDYTTRTYGIAFEDGVLSVDGQAANIVLYTLGDDACVLSYYNGETLVKQVSYNYLMVSQSACNINGHTNTVETTREATCTAPGERLTTCSVCGNQTVEDIPQLEHTYSNYTVQQEPTCTLDGIAANTCLTCGQEVTELLPALGHDWLPTSITDESWAMPDGVNCPDCHGTSFTHTRSDYEIVLESKNLFDVSQVAVGSFIENGTWISEVGEDYVIVAQDDGYTGNGQCGLGATLRQLAPSLVPGGTYTLSLDGDGTIKAFYIQSTGDFWYRGRSLTVTEDMLSSFVSVYGKDVFHGSSVGDSRISNIQIEEGTVATEYEPYVSKEVEIIPPIYHFTCDDCSNTWDAEAIYQHAYTTFTCSRCDETMIQSEDPDAGLFGSIGNFFADGITWITNKLSQFMDSLSGINDAFQDYMEEIKGSGGQFPAFLAAFVAVMPEDLMVALWFCLIAVVALLVWKKWFS